MVDFIGYCWDVRGCSGVTISNYVSAIRAQLGRHFQDPVPSNTFISGVLRFLQSQPRVRHHRDPAPPHLVSAVLSDPSIDLGVRAAVASLWFCSLRAGSVLSHRQRTFDPDYCLLRRDALFMGDRVGLRVRSLKADATNLGDTFWLSATGGPCCPVALLRRFWHATTHLPLDGPLFRWVSSGRLVSRGDISAVLRRHAVALGIPGDFLSPHSLRVGSATRLAEAGVSLQDIMLQGRWARTDSALRYLRATRPRARRLVQALSLQPSPPTAGGARHRDRASTSTVRATTDQFTGARGSPARQRRA